MKWSIKNMMYANLVQWRKSKIKGKKKIWMKNKILRQAWRPHDKTKGLMKQLLHYISRYTEINIGAFVLCFLFRLTSFEQYYGDSYCRKFFWKEKVPEDCMGPMMCQEISDIILIIIRKSFIAESLDTLIGTILIIIE